MAAKSAPAVESDSPTPSVGVDVLAEAFSAALKANAPKPRITIANRVAHNPMNPSNAVRKLDRNYYQNFNKIDVDDLTPEEYELLPQVREGNFISDSREGYLIEVLNVKRGSHRGIHIRYNNASIDTRMQLMTQCPNLASLLKRCIAEYASQKDERRRLRKLEEQD